ncbi:hypothetical protein RMN56_29485 [Micromonospora halotolerans]|uniref:Uncharacterized protein n=1 Tax=Micromonospora halotolerans TaxID=709879 RepID=A0ABY9ZVC3_9ACTN|nr:hypothetical protein [Micromonospora halotolerans]WNM39206.1 hypothetical protein RMN56_29485 [Micromonospora halotolerans]
MGAFGHEGLGLGRNVPAGSGFSTMKSWQRPSYRMVVVATPAARRFVAYADLGD